jgi:hypothetical protein
MVRLKLDPITLSRRHSMPSIPASPSVMDSRVTCGVAEHPAVMTARPASIKNLFMIQTPGTNLLITERFLPEPRASCELEGFN